MKWTSTTVKLKNPVFVPNLDPNIDHPDQFVEDYVSNLTKIPMDLSKPLWELHLLNIKTSDAEAVGVFWVHHSVGDGASLTSLLITSTRKTSNLEALPTVPIKNKLVQPIPTLHFGGYYPFGLFWDLFGTLVWILCCSWQLFCFWKTHRVPSKVHPGAIWLLNDAIPQISITLTFWSVWAFILDIFLC